MLGDLKAGSLELGVPGTSSVISFGGNDSITGTSKTMTDSRITANTAIGIYPTGTTAGYWTVESYAGYFVITSTASETACGFKWSALK